MTLEKHAPHGRGTKRGKNEREAEKEVRSIDIRDAFVSRHINPHRFTPLGIITGAAQTPRLNAL